MPDTPTYLAIADTIRGRISRRDEGWTPGDQIPGEDALAAEFATTTTTARKAVDRLRAENLVRSTGRRTYVRYIPPVRRLTQHRFSVSEREAGGARGAYDAEMTALGLKGSTRWIHLGPGPCPGDDNPGRGQATSAELLGVDPGETVMIRARHMLATPRFPDGSLDERNSETLQLATSFIPWDIAALHPQLVADDSGIGGIYSRLADVGHQVVEAWELSSARVGTDEECERLGLEPASVVQWLDRQAFDQAGRVVEICRHVYPPGNFVIVNRFDVDPID